MIIIKYPTWKIRGNPTPNEKLMICDVCGEAVWVPHSPLTNVCRCSCNNRQKRMRKATAAETEKGKEALKEII